MYSKSVFQVVHVDRREKKVKVWKPKKETVSESNSVSETEKNSVGQERDKLIRAETSFVNNEMGLQERRTRPTQLIQKMEPTAITAHGKEKEEKDKRSGPAVYVSDRPIALKNRFHVLESNEETET